MDVVTLGQGALVAGLHALLIALIVYRIRNWRKRRRRWRDDYHGGGWGDGRSGAEDAYDSDGDSGGDSDGD